jgi:hypothetical protein
MRGGSDIYSNASLEFLPGRTDPKFYGAAQSEWTKNGQEKFCPYKLFVFNKKGRVRVSSPASKELE